MLVLKQRLNSAGLKVSALVNEMSFSYPVVLNAINHGFLPVRKRTQFMEEVSDFLKERHIDVGGIWLEPTNSNQTKVQTSNHHEEQHLEAEMLTHASLKYFKLFRNPFLNDIREAKDVYLSDDSRYLLAAMRDAARNQGILALVGDSGAGKSVLRKQLLEELEQDGDVSIIQPKIIDKSVATAAGLCDAIIEDLSDMKPRRSMEAKARQVEELLRTASKGGQRHVLIIEEAHDLTVPLLKFLKRFWELEDGFSKLLGIVLIGQTELGIKLNEGKNYQLREFIRRCMVENVPALNHDIKGYLAHKFKRAGADMDKIMNADSFDAIRNRLATKGNGTSMLYPQLINNLVAKAMNLTQELGEPLITSDIIKEC